MHGSPSEWKVCLFDATDRGKIAIAAAVRRLNWCENGMQERLAMNEGDLGRRKAWSRE
jgi:hypothetical protein